MMGDQFLDVEVSIDVEVSLDVEISYMMCSMMCTMM